MRRGRGRGRRGPGLLGTMARTAVVAGTATAVSGRVAEAQHARRVATTQEPTAAEPAAPSVNELHTQLTKLGELRTAGLLTDEEFAAQKARLLGS